MTYATASFDEGSEQLRAGVRERTLGQKVVTVLTTTDHKIIGNM
ncbi:MAG: ctaD, partial [Aeromicrobium sp.]|nr:ctaD [Aeromicrobium sp.]